MTKYGSFVVIYILRHVSWCIEVSYSISHRLAIANFECDKWSPYVDAVDRNAHTLGRITVNWRKLWFHRMIHSFITIKNKNPFHTRYLGCRTDYFGLTPQIHLLLFIYFWRICLALQANKNFHHVYYSF